MTKRTAKTSVETKVKTHLTANGQSLQTKTVDKPFKCSVCNMTFNFMSNVKRHLRNMHKITDNLNEFIINGQKTNSDDPSVEQSEDCKSNVDTSERMP